MGFWSSHRERCLCAFCGRQRFVYRKSHVGVLELFASLATGVLVFLPFTEKFDARGIALGCLLLGFSEIFMSMRYRFSLRCMRCGFDPVVYRRSQESAARLVREHLQRRAEDPSYLLSEPVRPVMYRKPVKGRRRPLDSMQQR